jgi:hypothetical protein
MRLQRRVARLEQRWAAKPPVPPENRPRQERWENVVQRLDRLVRQADELMTDPEREQVRLAIEQLLNDFGGPYADWVRHLRRACAGCLSSPQQP